MLVGLYESPEKPSNAIESAPPPPRLPPFDCRLCSADLLPPPTPPPPSVPVSYVKEYLGVSLSQSDPAQSAALQEKDAEIAQLKAQVAQLQAQLQGKGADKGSEAGEKPSNATAAAAE